MDVRRVPTLTTAAARDLVQGQEITDRPVLVVYDRASPDARRILRDSRHSYAGPTGELFVYAPPVYVERPATTRSVVAPGPVPAPFAKRASRVSRWLLLHPKERPTFRELSIRLELSEALVSRTVRALADDGFVDVLVDRSDARQRRTRLRDGGALLDRLEQSVAGRRPRRLTWDVGARDLEGAMTAWRRAAKRVDRPYAVGGLAGASFIARAVEPTDLVVWMPRPDVEAWGDELLPMPARPAAGRITVQFVTDSFVLSLSESRKGLRIADPVQLYLDCRVAGERALDAAEAIREEMRW